MCIPYTLHKEERHWLTKRRDIHWFNTVKISRPAVEASLGPSKVDQRARNFFVLGASLSALFDVAAVGDLLKALLKLLEEWEMWTEGNTGGKGVVSHRILGEILRLIEVSEHRRISSADRRQGRNLMLGECQTSPAWIPNPIFY